MAPTYLAILKHFSKAKVLGITATPDRSDQRSLGEIFQEIAFEIELPELIEQGYLASICVETPAFENRFGRRRTRFTRRH
jgi:superfamily II DNA or RNA helicase